MIRLCLLLVVMLANVFTAEAKTPRGREVIAVIKEVVSEKRAVLVTFSKEDGARTLLVRWTRLSSAYEDGKEVSFDRLKPGLKIRLRYRSPLFGGPVISRIVWLDKKLESFWNGFLPYMELETSYG